MVETGEDAMERRARPDNQEESLDPQDWTEMRSLGRRMVDDMMTYLETIADRPVWQPMPEEVVRSFQN